MGVGLAVTYALVQEIGGQISVQSELGRGTRFKIRLPLKMPQQDQKDTGGQGPAVQISCVHAPERDFRLAVARGAGRCDRSPLELGRRAGPAPLPGTDPTAGGLEQDLPAWLDHPGSRA